MHLLNELVPCSHFLLVNQEIYYYQSRRIVSLNKQTLSSKNVSPIFEEFTHILKCFEQCNGVFYLGGQSQQLTYDQAQEVVFCQKITTLPLSIYPHLVSSKQYFGTAFCYQGNKFGGSGSKIYLQNDEIITPSYPVFSIFNSNFTSGKVATFTDHVHLFKSRSYSISDTSAGSENGIFYSKNHHEIQLYKAGIRSIQDDTIIQTNSAIIQIVNNLPTLTQTLLDHQFLKRNNFQIKDITFHNSGLIQLKDQTIKLNKQYCVTQAVEFQDDIVCLHKNGALSTLKTNFLQVKQLGQNSCIFKYKNTVFCIEFNSYVIIYQIYIEKCGNLAIFKIFQDKQITNIQVKNNIDVSFIDDQLICYLNEKVAVEIQSLNKVVNVLCDPILPGKEINHACFSENFNLIITVSEDGMLFIYDLNLTLLFNLNLHSSLKSVEILNEEDNFLQIIIGSCQNNLNVIQFRISLENIILTDYFSSRYCRLTANLKYTTLCVISKNIFLTGDSTGKVFIFLFAQQNFHLLATKEVDFCVFNIEKIEEKIIVSGSRGVVQFTVDLDILLAEETLLLRSNLQQVKEWINLKQQVFNTEQQILIRDQVVHNTSNGLYAFDTGEKYNQISGILACLNHDNHQYIIGWDRVLKEYKDKKLIQSVQVPIYQIHQLLLLKNAIAVIGNGISIISLE